MTIEDALAAVRANPASAESWYALGRLMAASGDKERARDCFTRAVALDPDARRPGARTLSQPGALPDWLDE